MRLSLPGILVTGYLLVSLSSPVAAQTPRYAMKDLPKPANALYCTGAASVNEGGDVAMNCTYKGGTRPEAARFCLASNWCIPYTTRLPWYYNLPTVWQANGTVRTLSLSTRATTSEAIMLNSGAVIATSVPLDVNGRPAGAGARWIWQATSNLAEIYRPPAALSGQKVVLSGITPGGITQWHREDGGGSFLATPDGQVKPMPQVPANGDVVRYAGETVFNDQGLRVVTRWVVGPPTQAEPFGGALPQAWFFNGQEWTRMPLPPGDLNQFSDVHINAQGHVVAHDRYDARYIWRADQVAALATLPGEPVFSEYLRISDKGVVSGALRGSGALTPTRAAIWVNGLPTDLNTITAAKPARLVLTQVQAMNGKGQMVVSGTDTGLSGDSAIKTVLLTAM
jgi:hypothetical protein